MPAGIVRPRALIAACEAFNAAGPGSTWRRGHRGQVSVGVGRLSVWLTAADPEAPRVTPTTAVVTRGFTRHELLIALAIAGRAAVAVGAAVQAAARGDGDDAVVSLLGQLGGELDVEAGSVEVAAEPPADLAVVVTTGMPGEALIDASGLSVATTAARRRGEASREARGATTTAL